MDDNPQDQSSLAQSVPICAGLSPCVLVIFLNGLAFGMVVPLLYYIADLSDGTPIGILIACHAVGRLAGRLAIRLARPNVPRLWIHWIWQAIAIVACTLLAMAGHLHVARLGTLSVLYCASLLAGFALSRFPAFPLLFPQNQRKDSAGTPLLIGFISGCAIGAIPASHWQAVTFILSAGIQTVPALCAAGICLLAALLCPDWQESRPTSKQTPGSNSNLIGCTSPNRLAVVLACEAAFAITVCVQPLVGWESYAIAPAGIALSFVLAGCISIAVHALGMHLTEAGRWSSRASLCTGLIFLAAGSVAFTGCCTFSRSIQPNVLFTGHILFWVGGILTGVSLGMLQATSVVEGNWPKPPRNDSLALDCMKALVVSAAALIASCLFAAHERTSFMLPAVLAGGGISFYLVGRVLAWNANSPSTY